MKTNKFVWIFVLFLLVLPLVFAEKIQINEAIPEKSLTIVYPKTSYFKQATATKFNLDILDYNLTRLDNTTTDCSIYVEDNVGDIIINGDVKYNTTLKTWYYPILETDLTDSGEYDFYVYCNSSNLQNGFVSESFSVKPLGINVDNSQFISIIILLPLIFGLLLVLGAFLLDPREHMVLRIFMFLLSLITYFASSWFGVQAIIRFTFATEMQDSLTVMVWVIGIVVFAILSYFLIYAFYKSVRAAAQEKSEMMG